MKRIHQPIGFTVASLALFMALSACGDGGQDHANSAVETTTPGDMAVVSSSIIAPNTFLTYNGSRYRLVDLEQANLIDEREFERIGTASQADIDQADLTIYRRRSDAGAVYTFSPERPGPTAVVAVEGESGNTPALWYRWVAEP